MSDEQAVLGSETMEPEHVPGQPEPGAPNPFADGDGDDVSGIAPPRWRRSINSETRKAMIEAGAKLKADGGAAAIDDEMVAIGEAEPERPAPGDERKPAAAPAPQLDPEIGRIKSEYEQRHAELDKREAEIAARETSGDTAKARDTYIDKPVQWWRDSLKTFGLGELSDDEYKRETADLINELSDSIGVPISQATKALMEQRRAVKYVRADKQQRAAREKIESEGREKARVESEWANAAVTLSAHLVGEAKATYPYLATIDRPGEAVVNMLRRAERAGQQLTWQEASKQANDYVKTQALSQHDKLKHLLNAAPGKPGGEASSRAEVAQGDPTGIRRSRTLSNAQAASTPTQPKPTATSAMVNGKWSREAHRKNTLQAFKERIKADE